MHRFRLAALVLPALAVGCQAADPSIDPLSDPQTWPVTYEANAYSGIWQDLDHAEEEPPVGAEPDTADEPGDHGMVLLECKILQCSRAELARWTGRSGGTFALEVPASAVTAFLERTQGDLVSAPKLMINPGAKGSIMVAEQVAHGASNREIAEALEITERTVKAHLSAIFEKLGVRDRVQLALAMNNIPTYTTVN